MTFLFQEPLPVVLQQSLVRRTRPVSFPIFSELCDPLRSDLVLTLLTSDQFRCSPVRHLHRRGDGANVEMPCEERLSLILLMSAPAGDDNVVRHHVRAKYP